MGVLLFMPAVEARFDAMILAFQHQLQRPDRPLDFTTSSEQPVIWPCDTSQRRGPPGPRRRQ
jgi:hypothetical protein